jgi:undecaprenyl-diphosphatase
VDALQAIVLGIVQGLTEFLPISSTAHLHIVPAILGWDDPGAAFTAVVQLGTMAAVLLYFRDDLYRIVVGWLRGLRDPELRRTHESRMGWYLVLATVPISLVGFALRHRIEDLADELTLIGSTLILFGLVLLAAERVGRRERDLDEVTTGDAVAVGLAQALALVPGVSRSGATISAGLLRGLDRAAAARFSFLLSVPAVVLSGLFELKDIGGDGAASPGATVLAILLAFVTGYASIAFLLRYLATHTTGVFVAYRVVLGAVVIALVAGGAIG